MLGANALLNRRIMSALTAWKACPWRLPCVTRGVPPRNIYDAQVYRTVKELTKGAKPMFQASVQATAGVTDPVLKKRRRAPVECSVFERHAMQLLQEAAYSARLENDFAGEDGVGSDSTAAIKRMMRQAVAAAKQQSVSAGVSAAERDFASISRSKDAAMMSMSFQDLVNSISEEATAFAARPLGGERSSRFALAAEFSQETTAVIGSFAVSGDGLSSTEGMAGAVAAINLASSESADNDEERSASIGSAVGGPMLSRRPARESSISAAKKAKQELEEKEREDEIEALKAQLAAASALVDALTRQRGDATNKVRQLESEVSSLHSSAEEVERDILLKRKTLEMLPSAADNIAALQNICAASAKKLMQLAQEWETHRRPLIERLREVNSRKARRRAQCRQMVEDMKRCRSEMVTMMQDLKEKQEKAQVLNEELGKMPKNLNRTLYTYRIMDIIASIGKQNLDINKITADIRDVQKTINSTTSTLQRADAITEEKIYGAATDSSDLAMIETYRQLRNLRAQFEELVNVVNKIGSLDKQAADLETKIEQETTRVSANNFERIKTDLDQVRAENAQLVAQIKSSTKK